jgi:hypothetical protein
MQYKKANALYSRARLWTMRFSFLRQHYKTCQDYIAFFSSPLATPLFSIIMELIHSIASRKFYSIPTWSVWAAKQQIRGQIFGAKI